MSDQEGMQIGNMGMNLARTFMMVNAAQGRQEDRKKKLQSEANIEKYIPMVQQGKEPDRKAKDFNYTDYLSAQTKVQQALNADVGYQNNILVKEDNQRKANQSNLDNMIASSKIYADQGDAGKAAEIIAPIYNFFPDGTEFVQVNPENRAQWIMKDQRTNEEYAIDAVPYTQASVMAKNFSKKYQETDKAFQEKRRTHNNLAITKRDVWKTPDGKKEAFYFPMLDKGGEIRETWKDTKTGEVVKGFDVRTGQNVESDLVFRSPEYFEAEGKAKKAALERRGKMADILHKEKQTGLLGKEKEGKLTPTQARDIDKSVFIESNKLFKSWRESPEATGFTPEQIKAKEQYFKNTTRAALIGAEAVQGKKGTDQEGKVMFVKNGTPCNRYGDLLTMAPTNQASQKTKAPTQAEKDKAKQQVRGLMKTKKTDIESQETKKINTKMAKSVEELDAMIPSAGMSGPYKKTHPWEGRAKTVGERVAGVTGKTQETQRSDIPRKGEDEITVALRRSGIGKELYDRNNIKMKLQAVYGKQMSNKEIAQAILNDDLLGG